MNFNVLSAIFKRDFIAYFSNPTGYVFICVFVVLSAAAAFWPPEFFSNNLANIDQLSHWMPFILLVFIPATGEFVIPFFLRSIRIAESVLSS